MDRETELSNLLAGVKAQAEELLENETLVDLSAEEILVLATELTTALPVTTIQHTYPIGVVDRSRVIFMIDDEEGVALSGEEYYDDD
jgi:hypothetical protein